MATPPSNPLFMLLNKKPASAVLSQQQRQRKIITIPHTATIAEALTTLLTNLISSAPIINTTTNLIIGGIDFLSILKALLQDHISYDSTSISSIAKYTNQFYAEDPVTSLIELLTSGAHRTLLYKSDFEILHTVSQSDVIKLINNEVIDVEAKFLLNPTNPRLANINAYIKTPLIDFDVSLLHEPITLQSTSSLFDAVQICIAHNYRVVGIVNEKGQLIGEFSVVKLLKYVHTSPNHIFDGNLAETFLKGITLLDFILSTADPLKELVCVDFKSTTLSQVLKLFVLSNAKTIYSLNEEKIPKQIITQTDILTLFRSSSYVKEPLDTPENRRKLESLWC